MEVLNRDCTGEVRIMEKMNCRLVSWEEVYSLTIDLAKKIYNSRYKPDTLIALARSGFVPGRILSDIMGIPDLVSLKVEHWLDTTGKHREDATIPYKIPFDIEDKQILVVDDIVDTGKSMKLSVEYLTTFKPKELRTCVMQYITSSILKPHYYAKKISDWTWFIYPWNFVEDIGNLSEKIMKTQAGPVSLNKVRNLFKETYDVDLEPAQLRSAFDFQLKRGRFTKTNKKYGVKA